MSPIPILPPPEVVATETEGKKFTGCAGVGSVGALLLSYNQWED